MFSDADGSIVCVSVCLLVSTMSCAKTAEPVMMPFAMWTRVVPLSHLLGVGLGEAVFRASPIPL